MKKQEKIDKACKHALKYGNKIIKQDLEFMGFCTSDLTHMIKSGELIRVSRGLYSINADILYKYQNDNNLHEQRAVTAKRSYVDSLMAAFYHYVENQEFREAKDVLLNVSKNTSYYQENKKVLDTFLKYLDFLLALNHDSIIDDNIRLELELNDIKLQKNPSDKDLIALNTILKNIIYKGNDLTYKYPLREELDFEHFKEYIKIGNYVQAFIILNWILKRKGLICFERLIQLLFEIDCQNYDSNYSLSFAAVEELSKNNNIMINDVDLKENFYNALVNKNYKNASIHLQIYELYAQNISDISKLQKTWKVAQNNQYIMDIFALVKHEGLLMFDLNDFSQKNITYTELLEISFYFPDYNISEVICDNDVKVIFRYNPNYKIGIDLNQLATSAKQLFNKRHYKEALEIYLKMLVNTSSPRSWLYSQISMCYSNLGEYHKALDFMQIADVISKQEASGYNYSRELNILYTKTYYEDESFFKKTLTTEEYSVFGNLKNTQEIISMVMDEKLPISDAFKRFDYSSDDQCLFLISLAKECYIQGMLAKGDYYLSIASNFRNVRNEIITYFQQVMMGRNSLKESKDVVRKRILRIPETV